MARGEASKPDTDQKKQKATTSSRKVCPVEGCGYSAPCASALEVHMRVHTGERPYQCTYPSCNYRAAALSNLRQHINNKHEKRERPHKCSYEGCNYSAYFVAWLKNHEKTHMTNNNSKSFHRCFVSGCNFTTTSLSAFRAHERACTRDGGGVRGKRIRGQEETNGILSRRWSMVEGQQFKRARAANDLMAELSGVSDSELFFGGVPKYSSSSYNSNGCHHHQPQQSHSHHQSRSPAEEDMLLASFLLPPPAAPVPVPKRSGLMPIHELIMPSSSIASRSQQYPTPPPHPLPPVSLLTKSVTSEVSSLQHMLQLQERKTIGQWSNDSMFSPTSVNNDTLQPAPDQLSNDRMPEDVQRLLERLLMSQKLQQPSISPDDWYGDRP